MKENLKKTEESAHDIPIVYNYTNYRRFIQDWFDYQKSSKKSFSHALFASKAGFRSRSFLLKVMKGEKRLSKSSIYQVSAAMSMGKKEQEYFNALVFFNEAKTLSEKSFYFEKLQNSHKSNSSLLLRQEQYKYFFQWYHSVIREIVTFKSFNGNFKKLGNMLSPPISEKKVRESVDLLLNLGFIKKTANGFIQTDESITTGDEVQSLAVQKFQIENMNLASRALEEFTQEKDISTLTFGIDENGYQEIKKEIITFRKSIIKKILEIDQKKLDRVYQMNFQLFPLSQTPKVK